jgi:hypothetical protein
MAQGRISQDMLWKFLVQHFLEDGLPEMVYFCGRLGLLVRHSLTFYFAAV